MERGKAFTVPHFALMVWAKPNKGIFRFIGIPGPLFIDFNDLQTVTEGNDQVPIDSRHSKDGIQIIWTV